MQILWIPPAGPLLAEAVDLVNNSDVAVAFVGLNPNLEGEEMQVNVPGFQGGDRTDLKIPEPQERLIESAIATGKPVVVVLTSGSALAANYAAEHAAAVLAGRLVRRRGSRNCNRRDAGGCEQPGRHACQFVTFYKSMPSQLPPFDEYSMKGRTYRYFTGEPLYGFGFGLSYSSFQYSRISTQRTKAGGRVSVRVKNTSSREGDEVVQLYVSGGEAPGDPIRSLRGFQRVHLRAGETRDVEFTLDATDLPKTKVRITVGGGQPTGKIPFVEAML